MIRKERLRHWQIFLWIIVLLAGSSPARADAVDDRMRQDVTFLASDECEGRGVSTKGIHLAADHIVKEFQDAGLKPGGSDGSYFQPFPMATAAAKLGSPNTLRLHGPKDQDIELTLNEQFRPIGLSGAGKVTAPLAFVGYGASAEDIAYDDYKGIDVAGKVVIILRRTPHSQTNAEGEPINPFDGTYASHHAALQTKLVNADLHKAAGVIFVSDRLMAAEDGDLLMDFALTAEGSSPTKAPVVQVRRSVVDKLLQSGLAMGLSEVEEEIDRNLKPHSALLPGWSADLEITVERPTVMAQNIVGIREGSGPLAGQTMVVGAHYDHLGYGGRGSLARLKEPAIHHGADDNASGTTVLMELARRYGRQAGYQGRRLVFIAFSGEESGLLGSEYYCKHPLFPLAETVAMINMDMVGRLRHDQESHKDKLIVYGTGTSPGFADLLDSLNRTFDFKMQKVAGATIGGERSTSDHASFYAKKIPILFLFTGNHPDYHRPSDTADKINVPGMHVIADLVQALIDRLAQEADRPQYVKVASPPGTASAYSSGKMPRLGIMPSYGDEQEGVLVDGVSEHGPAEKAGLKEGDRIVELGGQPVKNLDVYMVLMARHKKGQPLDVGVLRAGKKISIQVTPE